MEEQPILTSYTIEWSAFQSAIVAALLALSLIVVIAVTVLDHMQQAAAIDQCIATIEKQQ